MIRTIFQRQNFSGKPLNINNKRDNELIDLILGKETTVGKNGSFPYVNAKVHLSFEPTILCPIFFISYNSFLSIPLFFLNKTPV